MKLEIGSGVGLSGLVFVVFLALKLAEIGAVASWSWWWVTCPLWIVPGLFLAFQAVCGLFGAVGWIVTSIAGRNRWKDGA